LEGKRKIRKQKEGNSKITLHSLHQHTFLNATYIFKTIIEMYLDIFLLILYTSIKQKCQLLKPNDEHQINGIRIMLIKSKKCAKYGLKTTVKESMNKQGFDKRCIMTRKIIIIRTPNSKTLGEFF